jgi:DNA-binding NtrC family response regulator
MADPKHCILLVDDEEDILTSMRDYLEATIPGLAVRTANSGKAGLKILDSEKVDLIITDYKMPEMDGLEFLRKAAGFHPDVPRIILTAFPKLDLAIQAINEIEVDRFLTKPIRPEELEKVVRAFLGNGADETAKATSTKRAGMGGLLDRK